MTQKKRTFMRMELDCSGSIRLLLGRFQGDDHRDVAEDGQGLKPTISSRQSRWDPMAEKRKGGVQWALCFLGSSLHCWAFLLQSISESK